MGNFFIYVGFLALVLSMRVKRETKKPGAPFFSGGSGIAK